MENDWEFEFLPYDAVGLLFSQRPSTVSLEDGMMEYMMDMLEWGAYPSK